ncbi:MAG: T9SS type A sorting domain-containing protein [Saprospiraceae bacterium]
MRSLIFLFIISFSLTLHSQAIYKSSDPGSDWSSSNPNHIQSDGSVPSSGYSESNSSPKASGGNNVRFSDCTPPLSTHSLTSPAISTIGKSNIRIGFGQRHTPAFISPVILEWSSNGSSWNTISSNVVSGGTSTWSVSLFDLNASANNISTLQFRFTFTTSDSATNNCPVGGGNFRIDDFWVGANFKLPIQLAAFTLTLTHYPTLHWTTFSELNNDHFSIERSGDGNYFIEIVTIKGHSDADKKYEYSCIDYSPIPGINYYRLKQVDLDGSSTIYPMKSLVISLKKTLVYPTLSSQKINIEISDQHSTYCQWYLTNPFGQTILDGIIPEKNRSTIDIDKLCNGPYILRLKSSNYQETFKIIKI